MYEQCFNYTYITKYLYIFIHDIIQVATRNTSTINVYYSTCFFVIKSFSSVQDQFMFKLPLWETRLNVILNVILSSEGDWAMLTIFVRLKWRVSFFLLEPAKPLAYLGWQREKMRK